MPRGKLSVERPRIPEIVTMIVRSIERERDGVKFTNLIEFFSEFFMFARW